MRLAETGSKVTVSYVGTIENGKIFHSTDEHGPLVFTIGSDQVFPALERGVTGMRPKEVKNILLTAEEAYGKRLQENILQVKRKSFPAEKEIFIGQKLSIDFNGGINRVMIVIGVNEQDVTLDGNHPLAGCDLTFALRLDSID